MRSINSHNNYCYNSKKYRKIEFLPAYDLLNTSIVVTHAKEEIALSLNDKKNNLTSKDFISYFGKEKLTLTATTIEKNLNLIQDRIKSWVELIKNSFLSQPMQEKYLDLLDKRASVLF